MREQINFVCPKCSHTQYDIAEMRGAGGFWSKILDVQGQRFTSVACKHCRYTEFYKADSSMLGNIFDLFTN